ncbi:MAG: DEAD/DEAH box helicase [Desulfovibrio sp. S3730MH75]|nr:MAG: DEAD/DEAH box helicase [Desulfovibrio sp. S3730MH75]
MALLATFVGINKHSDPRISDLTGAVRDATALWALFSDSFPDIHPHLFTDNQANAQAIRQAMDDTLGAATPQDTALFFFAGHGTPGHQLVPYDTLREELESTTIPMDELADRLNSSRARAVVVILDCCFSGGATARVLQDVPVPRTGMITVADLQGKGRVIIAASKDDQAAYELRGHGLLTQALLDTFKNSKDGVDVGALMDGVTQRMRAEAGRFGWDQTPVIFNLIEGGLRFPPLKPGLLYASAFPDTSGIQVREKVHDLEAFNISAEVVAEWEGRFSELNYLQLKAVNDYRVLDGASLLVVAPTTSGKTFIGEMSAAKAIVDGRKAVFLLPYRALTNEKYEDFQSLYGDRLSLRVVRCTGDYTDDTDSFIRGRYDIALLTYEMFLGLSIAVPASLNKIGLLVLDEAQFIADPTRGINVELLLTNLISAHDRGVEPQIVALSAVIGAINHFDEWLGCKTLFTHERPVPLIEGVLDRSGTYQYIEPEGEEKTEQLLPPHTIIQRKKRAGSQDVIVPLVQKLISDGEQVLIFRNQRGSTVGCANYLANELHLPPATEVINQLPEHDPSIASDSLRRALNGGTAFHNSDLTREERLAIEQEFRDPKGAIRAMAATTTIAAGVNTPASTAIIVETFFYGDERHDFTVAEYKNMAGRAGRLGLNEKGRSILIADTAFDRERLFSRYVKGELEQIKSSFDPNDIDTWTLRLLAQVKSAHRDQIVRMIASTYGGYLESTRHPDWHQLIQQRLKALLERMLSLELLEEEEDRLRLTLLGKACGTSNLSFRSALNLVTLLKRISKSLTAERLMACLQTVPEVGGYTSIFKKGRKESAWQRDVTGYYGVDITQALQGGADDQYDYYARCKRAAILWAWINGEPIEAIEKRFSITPFAGSVGAGDVRGYADRTRMYLCTAYDIADVLLLGEGPDEEAIDRLLEQLETGLPADALELLNLPIALPRGEYLALYNAGHKEPDSVFTLSDEELRRYVGQVRIKQLIAHRT